MIVTQPRFSHELEKSQDVIKSKAGRKTVSGSRIFKILNIFTLKFSDYKNIINLTFSALFLKHFDFFFFSVF